MPLPLYEPKNYAEEVKQLLMKHKSFEIRISAHMRQERMPQRQIRIEEVWENLENPVRLYYAKKRIDKRKWEESYKCYFRLSGQQCHIYGIVFNFRYKFIKLATVIKDRIRLQRKFKHDKN
jgi:hypothetical protein